MHDTRRRKMAIVLAALLALLAAAGAVLGAADPFHGTDPADAGVTDNAYPTALSPVTRQDLSAQTQVNATLGYAGSYTVVNRATGIFTALPAPGQVIRQGQVLYRVGNAPVVLLYGSVPAYLNLAEGMSGPDVAELNADLAALGGGPAPDPASGFFSAATAQAVARLQASLGLSQTLPRATPPRPARGTKRPSSGAGFAGPLRRRGRAGPGKRPRPALAQRQRPPTKWRLTVTA